MFNQEIIGIASGILLFLLLVAGMACVWDAERDDGTSPFWALVITIGALPLALPIYLFVGAIAIPAWITSRFE